MQKLRTRPTSQVGNAARDVARVVTACSIIVFYARAGADLTDGRQHSQPSDVEKTVRAFAITLLVALLLPSAAFAAPGTNAPPGNSGVDEYLEAIPDTTGSRPAQQIPQHGGSAQTLSRSAAQKLNALGADGHAVAGLVVATAPKQAAEKRSTAVGNGQSKDSSGSDATLPSGGAPAIGKAAADTVDGGGGLGLLLPIAIGAILLAAIAARVFRRARA